MAWSDHAPKWYTRRFFTKPERRQRRMEERRLLKREQDPDEMPTPPRTGRHRAAWDYW